MSKIRGLCLCLVTQWVLNWAFTALTAQFHPAQPSVIAVVWRETRVEQNACTSHHCIIVIQPQLKLDCACGRGVQKYCFLLWWCWNTSREGAYYVVTGGGTSTVSENPDVFFFFIYILFLNTVGYLFMWQKQGCPASVYSKYFICQILAALVTISSVISVVKWICFHCSLNFPSSAFFPQADV